MSINFIKQTIFKHKVYTRNSFLFVESVTEFLIGNILLAYVERTCIQSKKLYFFVFSL